MTAVPLGREPGTDTEGVGPVPPDPDPESESEPEPDPDPVVDGEVPVAEMTGEGDPTSVPDGNGGNVFTPSTICWSAPARFEMGPPGNV